MSRWFILLVVLLGGYLSTPNPARAACTDTVPVAGLTGFVEAVLSVRDIEGWRDDFVELGGWEEVCRSDDVADLASHGLDGDVAGATIVLRNPNAARGLIRLLRFDGVEQQRIRSSAQAWDTGGIFDLYFWVPDADAIDAALRARGYSGFVDPVEYGFGDSLRINEAMIRGPQDIGLCLMEQITPPMTEARAMGAARGIGAPWNANLIVADLDANRRFFEEQLGWHIYFDQTWTDPAPGTNTQGVPLNIAMTVPKTAVAYSPNPDDRTGSIQIQAWDGLVGIDHADKAVAPNLGILALRVPVADAAAYAREIAQRGAEIALGPVAMTLDPYGPVTLFSVHAPNGSRIDFFSPAE